MKLKAFLNMRRVRTPSRALPAQNLPNMGLGAFISHGVEMGQVTQVTPGQNEEVLTEQKEAKAP
jgi:hypothetical protein